MFERLRELLRPDQADEERVDPALAAAALMFEVVWADHEVDEKEVAAMASLLTKLFGLDSGRVEEVIAETRANHDASVGVFSFTRALNEQLSQDEKYDVLRAMWAIAFADEQIDSFEEHTIRRIAELLYVSHENFIAAKREARREKDVRTR